MPRRGKIDDIEKIKKRFPKEWLLIADYEVDKVDRLLRGRVIAHSKKRDEIYQKQMKIKGPLAIEYSGPIPKDLVVMFYV